MKFIEKVAQKADAAGGDEMVKAVYIGLSYCFAVLENSNTGLGFVFNEDLGHGCSKDLPRRPLAGSRASELLDFAGRGSLANSVSLAVANAVLTPMAAPDTIGDILEHLHLSQGTRVGMVGHFAPLVPLIKKKGARLTVCDLHPDPLAGILGPEDISEVLPKCEIALITATSIINETIDGILSHAQNCRNVVVLGPSAPMAPICYEGTNVTCASGVRVREKDKMKTAVVEGGGMKVFKPFVDKVNVDFPAFFNQSL